jgi:SulP family sulfate permease
MPALWRCDRASRLRIYCCHLQIGESLSRSAANDKSGAQSPLAGGVAAMSIAVVLLFLTGLFTNLPETIMAAVVIVAVKGLFRPKR